MSGSPAARAAAARAAAARITGHPRGPADDDERRMLEIFYSLVALLPGVDGESDLVVRSRRASLAEPSTVPRAAGEPRRGRGAGSASSPRRARPVAVPLPALVGLIAALVFVVALLFVPRVGFRPEAALFLGGTGAARSARGVVLAGAEELLVFATGLSELEPGYRYVVWDVDATGYRRIGSPVDLGGGRARLRVAMTRLPDRMEITIEPSTATGSPRGPTVLTGFRTQE